MTASAAPTDGWTLARIPDLAGRIAMVTGANSGIGYCTARELARRGAHVVLACRDPGRGEQALARMTVEVPSARLDLVRVDLASHASIRACAASLGFSRLDLLVNNAGVALVPFARTVDGFESHFGINHLGTFALTGLLLPRLLAADRPRVVTVTSEGQRFAPFHSKHLDAKRGPGVFGAFRAYLQSKRANLYFAAELQRRADAVGSKLRSMAVAPGLTRSNVLIGGANRARSRLYHAVAGAFLKLAFRATLEGAKTSLFAATCPDLAGGSYVVPDGPLQLRGAPVLRPRDRALHHHDEMRALWQLSEQLTGVRFDLNA
jgi:NAD(P)-dependent dehydrogenase (short-subunit alcohol dehydrogenase family)